MLRGKFLRPGVDAGHIGEVQLPAHRLQELDALVQGVQQRQADGGLQHPQGQTGKTGTGADVHYGLPGKGLQGQQGGAVQKVESGHILRVRNGGEVHHLVGLDQQIPIPDQSRDSLHREVQGGKTRLQALFHHVLSFSRSRISASSTSSCEGWGGGGGAASFFRWKRLIALMRQKTAKAMMRKSRIVERKEP